MKLEWSDQLEIGIYSIDSQHMDLVDKCNAFLAAVSARQSRNAVERLIHDLREYSVRHFHDEEQLMAQIRYPRRGEHEVEHRSLVKRVKEFQRDLYKDATIDHREVLKFLKSWLIDHILKSDMRIGEWMRDQERKAAAKAQGAVTIGKPKPDAGDKID